MTPNELTTFYNTEPLSSIKLRQAGNGNSMLTEITADITNKGIETLLDAAQRGLVDQKKINQVTNQKIGEALGDVFMEDGRPSNLTLADIAIWSSKSQPGMFAVKLAGSELPLLVNDKAAALDTLGAHIQDQLGSPIDVQNTESEYYSSSVAVPTIWAGSKGQLNLSLPYGLHFDDTPDVTGTFEQVKIYVAEAHQAMLNKATEAQKETRDNLYVGKILPQLSDNMNKLRETLAPPRKVADYRYLQQTNKQVALNRYGNIQSLVHSSLNPNLNANRIKVNGTNVAIATQYPLQHQIQNHLRMLVDNNIPVVTVIAEQSEMEKPINNMSDYFSGNLDVDTIYGNINPEPEPIYGNLNPEPEPIYANIESTGSTTRKNNDVTTTSTLKQQDIELGKNVSGEPLLGNVYALTINTLNDEPFTVEVLHVHNWKDHTAVDANTTLQIAAKVIELADESKNDGVPVIHCKAGVGRTGQVLAALVMEQDQYNTSSLESIVTGMRESRNGYMVQNDDQLKVLAKIAVSQNRSILTPTPELGQQEVEDITNQGFVFV